MTSFSDDLRRFTEKLEANARTLFVGSTERVQTSVVEGSALTGAPGQPVDVGTLRGSWVEEFVGEWLWRTTTNMAYAEAIENAYVEPHTRGPYTRKDGTTVRAHSVVGHALTLRSEVGGFHSVKLTRAGWQNIVDDAAGEVAP